MHTSTTTKVLLLITCAGVAAGAIAYPGLPEQIASHWNAAGEADGDIPRFWGVFLFPMIMLVMAALYAMIPRIDPLKENFAKFRRTYDLFWVMLFVYLAYVQGLSLAWNLGARFDFTRAMVPAVGALFIIIGSVIAKAERNWFFGIRTPWTLSSEEVWKRTHALGGTLFRISGVIGLMGVIFGGRVAVLLLILPIVISSAVLMVYSYLAYRALPPDRKA